MCTAPTATRHCNERAKPLRTSTSPAENNLSFFTELLDNAEFNSGHYDTGIIARMRQK
jgi:hypothetical protein